MKEVKDMSALYETTVQEEEVRRAHAVSTGRSRVHTSFARDSPSVRRVTPGQLHGLGRD